MLSFNELKPGTAFVLDGQPYTVMESNFLKMQMRKPVMQTKLKNIITGKTMEKSFQATDKLEEAEIEIKSVKYLYNSRGEFWFCEQDDPSKRFKIEADLIGNFANFMKTNSLVEFSVFEDNIIGVRPPIKMELKVTEAPPAVKGNTVQGGTKQITLETGAVINAPMFVQEGDIVSVNTESGLYAERVTKG